MPSKILLFQPETTSARLLADFFKERATRVWQSLDPAKALSLLEQVRPDLALIDLHLPDGHWQDLLRQIRRRFPRMKVIATLQRPDPMRELQAKDLGVLTFLRQPFTQAGIERALKQAERRGGLRAKGATGPAGLTRVRVPVRVKITLPFALLALLVALATAFVTSRVVLETSAERFTNQLVEMGQLAADWMVQEEKHLLETLRLLANTAGISEALAARDAEALRQPALAVAVNYQEEAIEFLDTHGTSVLSLRHHSGGGLEDYQASQGDAVFSQWPFVQSVLAGRTDDAGDKYAGIARASWGDYLYVAGPILDDQGRLVGVILIGKSLPTVVRQIRENSLAHITIYGLDGSPMASTLLENSHPLPGEQVRSILEGQDRHSLIRGLKVASIQYSEILGPWEVRGGQDLGLIGTSLSQAFLVGPSQEARIEIFLLMAVAFLLVVAVGFYLANRLTQPLLQVVQASAEVAQGNLDVRVEPTGDDELAVLAHSFNRMVAGLQEGTMYRDILGRTVSPEVRDQLRRTFAAGDLRLEGQNTVATVLLSDIRSFTALAEHADPPTLLAWLNEYFGELVPIIAYYGGVVDKFGGDSLVAFFGVLPRVLPPADSAYYACRAAVEMIQATEEMNARRLRRGEPPFVTGIGINTGPVIAGGLGTADRLEYTIIGDTVNTTQRLEDLTRHFPETGAVVSEYTVLALQARSYEFHLEPMGPHALKGKSIELRPFRLRPTGINGNARPAEA